MSELTQHNALIMKVGDGRCIVCTVTTEKSIDLPKKGDIFVTGVVTQKNIQSRMLPQMTVNSTAFEDRTKKLKVWDYPGW